LKVLVHAINHAPELTGCGKYTGDLVAWLSTRDHEVRVITTFQYYPEWKKNDRDRGLQYRREILDGATVTRCPHWVSGRLNVLRRILHLLSFVISSFPILIWTVFRWRPEVVYMVAPTLLGAPMVLILSKLFGVRSWIHIQDFEVDVMLGIEESRRGVRKGMKESTGLCFERLCLSRADRVSSISPAMVDKLVEKGVSTKKTSLFPNWVDLDFYQPLPDEERIRKEFGYTEDDVIILYAGNIGLKQGLDQLPELVERCTASPNIKFLIVGEGIFKARLKEELSEGVEKNRVKFLPLQSSENLVRIMTIGDLHLVLQRKEVKDLVLPSKLTTILSMGGHALITASKGSTLGNLVEEHPGVASLLEPGDSEALYQFLISWASSRPAKPNAIARGYAEEKLGREKILMRFEKELRELDL
jgi:colanic acid biosynthesis glycosyl transferase WcaI